MKHSFKAGQAANDFKVVVRDKDWSQEWIDIISTQTTAAQINLVKKQVKIRVRQLSKGWIQDLIFHILKKDTANIDEIRISPAKRASYEYIFKQGRLIDHDAVFDLFDRSNTVHILTFEFDAVSLHSSEKHSVEGVVDIAPTRRIELNE